MVMRKINVGAHEVGRLIVRASLEGTSASALLRRLIRQAIESVTPDQASTIGYSDGTATIAVSTPDRDSNAMGLSAGKDSDDAETDE